MVWCAGAAESDRRGEPVAGGERDPLTRDHGHRPPQGVQRRQHRHHARRGRRLREQGDYGEILILTSMLGPGGASLIPETRLRSWRN
jgi:hypothetical protein